MALKQIPNLPSVVSLSGDEELEAVQAGVSVKVTSAQIASLVNGAGVVLINTTAPISGGPITASGVIGLQDAGVTNTYLGVMNANTVKANATAGSASPTDVALAVSQLLGRGNSGNIAPIILGTNLTMTGTTLDAAGGAGGITQLTADVTAGPGSGSLAATLATVNANVGSFGLAASVGQFTVNAKGLITAAANVAIAIASTAITDATASGRAMLTAASVAAQTALLDVFTSGLKGLAPASGGGTTNYLRADGTWDAPAGTGGGSVSMGIIQARAQNIGVW